MTEEQKALFMKEVKRIALDMMGLAMEFPEMGLLDIAVDDDGYYNAYTSNESTIFSVSKTAGHAPTYTETKVRGKA
jgi:hypothetical protein